MRDGAGVVFRPSRPEDVEPLHALWVRSALATHDFLSPEDFEEISGLVLSAYLPNNPFLVAECAGELAGFMGQTGRMIDSLYLDPAFIGRGIGRRFIAEAEKAGLPIRVDVNEQNGPAHAFYLHMGFIQRSRSETDDAGRPYPLLHLIKRR